MVLKLINNTLTLFFGENGCKTETGVGNFIERYRLKMPYLQYFNENTLCS